MTPDEKRIRQKLKDDFRHYAAKCLRIRSKSGEVVPFIFNKAQNFIHEKVEAQRAQTGKVRIISVKGRQEGFSTYVEGRFYWRITHSCGYQAFILTHSLDATANLYKMVQRYHENCPRVVRPDASTSNSKELLFGGLDSGYKIGTAENKSVGRSSTIQLFHWSEVAYSANADEHAKGIAQAVPDAVGTESFLESTANGVGNYFHEQWQRAESGHSDYLPLFIPWFWADEYRKDVDEDFKLEPDEEELKAIYLLTDDQLMWRRKKIQDLSTSGQDGHKSFMTEYPNNSVEAFQMSGMNTFISPDIVIRARKTRCEKFGPLIIGVDPARFGDDRTAIIRRQTRCVYGLETYNKKDTMEVVGIVHNIILNERPAKVFVDVGGLGAGVVDRLWELGHRGIVIDVNSGSSSLDQRKYFNKRAEMWGEMKMWLSEPPTQIPDDDALHADLCSVKYDVDSNGRTKIEESKEMKKRGIRSPDCAAALYLTFAMPVSAYKDVQSKQTASIMMSDFKTTQRLKGNRQWQI